MQPPNHDMNPMRVIIKIHKSDPPTLLDAAKWCALFCVNVSLTYLYLLLVVNFCRGPHLCLRL